MKYSFFKNSDQSFLFNKESETQILIIVTKSQDILSFMEKNSDLFVKLIFSPIHVAGRMTTTCC